MPKDTWWNLPEAKRQRIIDAALVEFGARGFSAGSLNTIARDADIAKGSLFQYFEDKLDMFASISSFCSEAIRSGVLDVVGSEPEEGFFTFVRRLVGTWLQYFRDHPAYQAMAFAVANEIDAEARAATRRVANEVWVATLGPMVKRAADRAEFQDGVDPDQVIAMVVLLLRHLDSAPFLPHIDPVLGLHGAPPARVEEIALDLVDALERAYGRP